MRRVENPFKADAAYDPMQPRDSKGRWVGLLGAQVKSLRGIGKHEEAAELERKGVSGLPDIGYFPEGIPNSIHDVSPEVFDRIIGSHGVYGLPEGQFKREAMEKLHIHAPRGEHELPVSEGNRWSDEGHTRVQLDQMFDKIMADEGILGIEKGLPEGGFKDQMMQAFGPKIAEMQRAHATAPRKTGSEPYLTKQEFMDGWQIEPTPLAGHYVPGAREGEMHISQMPPENKAAKKKFESVHGPLLRDGDGVQDAVGEYRYLWAYDNNGPLRKGERLDGGDNERILNSLEYTFDNRLPVLDHDLTVYRSANFTRFDDDLQPGDRFVDNGFTSTSLDPGVAETARRLMNYNQLAAIEIPKGSHVMYATAGEEDDYGDAELVIRRGGEYEVLENNPEAGRLRLRLVRETFPDYYENLYEDEDIAASLSREARGKRIPDIRRFADWGDDLLPPTGKKNSDLAYNPLQERDARGRWSSGATETYKELLDPLTEPRRTRTKGGSPKWEWFQGGRVIQAVKDRKENAVYIGGPKALDYRKSLEDFFQSETPEIDRIAWEDSLGGRAKATTWFKRRVGSASLSEPGTRFSVIDLGGWDEATHPRDADGKFARGLLPDKLKEMGVTRTPPVPKYHKVLFGPDGPVFWPSRNITHWHVAKDAAPSYIRYVDGDKSLDEADFAFGQFHDTETRGEPSLELQSDARNPSPKLAKQILDAYGEVDPLPVLRFNGSEIPYWDLELKDLIAANLAFNPLEPRDEHGRWVHGTGNIAREPDLLGEVESVQGGGETEDVFDGPTLSRDEKILLSPSGDAFWDYRRDMGAMHETVARDILGLKIFGRNPDVKQISWGYWHTRERVLGLQSDHEEPTAELKDKLSRYYPQARGLIWNTQGYKLPGWNKVSQHDPIFRDLEFSGANLADSSVNLGIFGRTWEEAKHPRDPIGRFDEVSGKASGRTKVKHTATKSGSGGPLSALPRRTGRTANGNLKWEIWVGDRSIKAIYHKDDRTLFVAPGVLPSQRYALKQFFAEEAPGLKKIRWDARSVPVKKKHPDTVAATLDSGDDADVVLAGFTALFDGGVWEEVKHPRDERGRFGFGSGLHVVEDKAGAGAGAGVIEGPGKFKAYTSPDAFKDEREHMLMFTTEGSFFFKSGSRSFSAARDTLPGEELVIGTHRKPHPDDTDRRTEVSVQGDGPLSKDVIERVKHFYPEIKIIRYNFQDHDLTGKVLTRTGERVSAYLSTPTTLAPNPFAVVDLRFDPAQPRDDRGRWTSGLNEWADSGISASFQGAYKGWSQHLSREEREALDTYALDLFGKVNKPLRDNEGSEDALPERLRERVRVLDSAIAKGATPEDAVVYRGLELKRWADSYEDGSLVGATVTDYGYISTSLAPKIADFRRRNGSNQAVIARISVPAGTSAAYMPALGGRDIEKETLLPRGSSFKVTGLGQRDGIRYLELDLLPVELSVAETPQASGEPGSTRFIWGEADIKLVFPSSPALETTLWSELLHPRDLIGRFTHGNGGSSAAPDSLSTSDRLKLYSHAQQSSYGRSSSATGDKTLGAVASAVGFDAKPRMASPKEVDAAIAAGATGIVRGGQRDHLDQWATGEYHAGIGAYGSGTYYATGHDSNVLAKRYAKQSGVTQRGALAADARIVGYNRVLKLQEDEADSLSAPGDKKKVRGMDPGVWAALHGYDAIDAGTHLGDIRSIVVLNRGKLLLEPLPEAKAIAASGDTANPFQVVDLRVWEEMKHPRDRKGRFTSGGLGNVFPNWTPGAMADVMEELDKRTPPRPNKGTTTATEERTDRYAFMDVSDVVVGAKNLDPKRSQALSDALRAIDAVHGDGFLPEIKVFSKHSKQGEDGEYDPFTYKVPRINLTDTPGANAAAMVHELGHFLDHNGLGTGNSGYDGRSYGSTEFGSFIQDNRKMKKLMETIDNSPEIQQIKAQKEIDPFGALLGATYEAYLDRPEEKFARAYTQWITIKSQDPLLRRQLQDTERIDRGRPVKFQWDYKNFEPIYMAFNDLFKDMGWLR